VYSLRYAEVRMDTLAAIQLRTRPAAKIWGLMRAEKFVTIDDNDTSVAGLLMRKLLIKATSS